MSNKPSRIRADTYVYITLRAPVTTTKYEVKLPEARHRLLSWQDRRCIGKRRDLSGCPSERRDRTTFDSLCSSIRGSYDLHSYSCPFRAIRVTPSSQPYSYDRIKARGRVKKVEKKNERRHGAMQ